MSSPEPKVDAAHEVDAAAHEVEIAAPKKPTVVPPPRDVDVEEGWDMSDDEGRTFLDGVLDNVAGTLAGTKTPDVETPDVETIGANVNTLTTRVDQVEGEVNLLKSTIRPEDLRAPASLAPEKPRSEEPKESIVENTETIEAKAAPAPETKEKIDQAEKPTVDELMLEMARYL